MATPEEMAQAMIDNIKEKTGKTLSQWLKITQKSGLEKHGQLVKMLKTDHGMTHGYANLVAHKTLKSDAESAAETVDLVAAQYAGPKADLLPIYEALIKIIKQLGGDVEIAPKKAYVSLRRKKQFAIIQPSTKTRVDLGVNLSDTEPTDRLEASGSFNAMVSHRIRLDDKAQVDREIGAWLKAAYEAAG